MWNFDVDVGATLGLNFDLNIGRTAGETCSATLNLVSN
jgi:hypothetical protein